MLSEKTLVTAEYVINGLKELVEKCNDPVSTNAYNASAAAKCYDLLGKHLGLYVERRQHEGSLNISPLVINIRKPDK